MATLRLDMLEPEQVMELWPKLEPMVQSACEGNDLGYNDICPGDVYALAVAGMCAIFVGTVDDEPGCVIALQFTEANGHKGAEIITMAGEHLMRFKAAYWQFVLDWLKANGCTHVSAYAPHRLAKIYMSRFGFTNSCSYVRMAL